MSLGTTILILTIVAGLGGAAGGAYVSNAPWWACILFGGAGLVVGAIASLVVGGLSGSLAGRQDASKSGFLAFVGTIFLPFVAVLLVGSLTVGGSIVLSGRWWPERASTPRDFGGDESL